ncbi:MAG: PKD domain-containing protein, partial [Bacteroidales bacterium]|nr:PKD domain-containing protein [Bacteroidales bacterium]
MFTAAQEICTGGPPASLTLTAYTGQVGQWLFSGDSLNWGTINNPSASYQPPVFDSSRFFSAVVTNGVCQPDTSLPVKITVHDSTLAGNIAGFDTVCSSANLLSLNNTAGNGRVLRWEQSPTGTSPWALIENPTNGLNIENLGQTTWYRAIRQNGACPSKASVAVPVWVDQPPTAGQINGTNHICRAQSNLTWQLANEQADSLVWQINATGSWQQLSNGKKLTLTELAKTSILRNIAVNHLNACPADTSQEHLVQVDSVTVPGWLGEPGYMCERYDTLWLNLNEYRGTVQQWESSPAANGPWTVFKTSADSFQLYEPKQDTYFRVLSQSGLCNAAYSPAVLASVDRLSLAGTLSGGKAHCKGQGAGSLTLTGYRGNVIWQSSINQSVWQQSFPLQQNKLEYNQPDTTRFYRTIADNGVCPPDTSNIEMVTVHAIPKPWFLAPDVDFKQTTAFTNQSYIDFESLASYYWDFGDGENSYSTNPTYKFKNAGSHYVKLTATSAYGCQDSIALEVVVNPLPGTNFTADNQCLGVPIQFVNGSGLNNDSLSFLWQFGDGNISALQNPTHLYNAPGTYSVKLIATSPAGAADSISKEVTVYHRSQPAFEMANGCFGTPTAFTNRTTSFEDGISFAWQFGDNQSDIIKEPAHTYASHGEYAIKLVVTTPFGCADSISKTVTIYPTPVARFFAKDVPYGIPLYFYDSSTIASGGLDYLWDFGNSKNSQEQNPVHLYESPGTYKVSLKVTSTNNCTSETAQNITINTLPNAVFKANNVCHGDTMYFINESYISAGTLSYDWNMGDGTIYKNQHPAHRYQDPGQYTVRLICTSDKNGKDTVYQQVEVYPNPVADFSTNLACFGYPTYFTNLSTVSKGQISEYLWDLNEGTNSIQKEPVKIYEEAKEFAVSLTTTTNFGCVKQMVKTIEVDVNPVADFDFDNACLGEETRFFNRSIITNNDQLNYLWHFGDETTGTAINPSHAYTEEKP